MSSLNQRIADLRLNLEKELYKACFDEISAAITFPADAGGPFMAFVEMIDGAQLLHAGELSARNPAALPGEIISVLTQSLGSSSNALKLTVVEHIPIIFPNEYAFSLLINLFVRDSDASIQKLAGEGIRQIAKANPSFKQKSAEFFERISLTSGYSDHQKYLARENLARLGNYKEITRLIQSVDTQAGRSKDEVMPILEGLRIASGIAFDIEAAPKEFVKMLTSFTPRDDQVKGEIITIVGIFGGRPAVDYLRKLMPPVNHTQVSQSYSFHDTLPQQDFVYPPIDDTQLRVAKALGDTKSYEAAAFLESVIKQAFINREVELARTAIYAIGRLKFDNSIEFLRSIALERQLFPKLRADAVEAIGAIGGKKAVKALATILFAADVPQPLTKTVKNVVLTMGAETENLYKYIQTTSLSSDKRISSRNTSMPLDLWIDRLARHTEIEADHLTADIESFNTLKTLASKQQEDLLTLASNSELPLLNRLACLVVLDNNLQMQRPPQGLAS